jgi:hypothetical protein
LQGIPIARDVPNTGADKRARRDAARPSAIVRYAVVWATVGAALTARARRLLHHGAARAAVEAAVRRGVIVICYGRRVHGDRLDQLRALQPLVPQGTIVAPDTTGMRYAVAVAAYRRLLGCARLHRRGGRRDPPVQGTAHRHRPGPHGASGGRAMVAGHQTGRRRYGEAARTWMRQTREGTPARKARWRQDP